jgi:opacity protein-like surface antigen
LGNNAQVSHKVSSEEEKNMKKILSVLAVSAFVLTANAALAGGPGKKSDAGCPAACQQQIDDLNSSQAQQNEQLGAHSKQLQNHEGRITTLEKNAYNPWYVRVGVRAAWMSEDFGNGHGDANSDAGFGAAVAFGRQFGQFRTELELAKQRTDISHDTIRTFNGTNTVTGDKIDVTTVMVNAYYEIPVTETFAFYGMGGLGYGKNDADVTSYDQRVGFAPTAGYSPSFSDNVLAYKLGAGMTYNIAASRSPFRNATIASI